MSWGGGGTRGQGGDPQAPTYPRSPLQPRTHRRGAGRDARAPHPPDRRDSAAREPAPGPPGSSLRPAPPAARLRQDKQASAAATTGPSGARSPSPPRLPGIGIGIGIGRSHSRAAGRALSHTYPLQDPPKHGLASRRRRRRRRGDSPCRGRVTHDRRARGPAGDPGGGQERGGGGRCLGGRDFLTDGEAASTSQRAPRQQAPACRAAPVTDSWAGRPLAEGRSRCRPASSACPSAWRAGPEEGRPEAPTNRKRG